MYYNRLYDTRRFDGLDIIATTKLFEKYEMNVNLFRYDVNNKTYSMFAQYVFSNEFVTVNLLMLNVKDRFHLS